MAEQKKSENQSGEKLPDIVRQYQDKIFAVAVPSILKNSEQWLNRAILEISQNKELTEFVTVAGKGQFIAKLAKAAQVGLQLGGVKPHAYFINMGGQLRMDITKEGLAHACVHGQGAVLDRVPEIIRVYANDKFTINQAAKTYTHEFDPTSPRGDVKLWYTVLNYKNGFIEIPYVTLEKVKKIRLEFSQDKISKAWKTSEEEMEDKIATKQLLKKPFAEAEGLSMLVDSILSNGLSDTTPTKSNYSNEDISKRASTIVDTASSSMGKGTEVDPPSIKDVTPPKQKEEKKEGDMF